MLVKEQELLIKRVDNLSNGNNELLEQLCDKNREITQLQEEVRGWKAASSREGIFGFVIGGLICLTVGILIGNSL